MIESLLLVQFLEEPELPVSTTCRVFAVSEAIGLLRGGASENEMLATYLFAIAWRLFSLIGRIEPKEDLAFTGGLAKNPGIAKRLETAMKMTAVCLRPSLHHRQTGWLIWRWMAALFIHQRPISTVTTVLFMP